MKEIHTLFMYNTSMYHHNRCTKVDSFFFSLLTYWILSEIPLIKQISLCPFFSKSFRISKTSKLNLTLNGCSCVKSKPWIMKVKTSRGHLSVSKRTILETLVYNKLHMFRNEIILPHIYIFYILMLSKWHFLTFQTNRLTF